NRNPPSSFPFPFPPLDDLPAPSASSQDAPHILLLKKRPLLPLCALVLAILPRSTTPVASTHPLSLPRPCMLPSPHCSSSFRCAILPTSLAELHPSPPRELPLSPAQTFLSSWPHSSPAPHTLRLHAPVLAQEAPHTSLERRCPLSRTHQDRFVSFLCLSSPHHQHEDRHKTHTKRTQKELTAFSFHHCNHSPHNTPASLHL
ncbi:hypothetical protein EI42_06156, partial [Thermosporothrix hazakensis]